MSLREAALAVRENAHAPYSRFKVGAAVQTDTGQVFVGCNVENVAYPEGTCAEAGAIAAMAASGARSIQAVYVVADSPTPVAPCGGCRQKIAEFAGGDVVITMLFESCNNLNIRLSNDIYRLANDENVFY
ncbi:MAG: cytidine deaminase [Paracoccaceae bacterium]